MDRTSYKYQSGIYYCSECYHDKKFTEKMDEMNAVLKAAKAEGLSYGQYMLLHKSEAPAPCAVKSCKRQNKTKQPAICFYYKDGTFYKKYRTIEDADVDENNGVTRQTISAALNGCKVCRKWIIVYEGEPLPKCAVLNIYDLNGNYITHFNGVSEAAEAFNVTTSTVTSAINHQRPMCDKYRVQWSDKPIETTKCDKRKRQIVQLDKDGRIINFWNSATEAAEKLHINRTNIYHALSGESKSCIGYVWRYV